MKNIIFSYLTFSIFLLFFSCAEDDQLTKKDAPEANGVSDKFSSDDLGDKVFPVGQLHNDLVEIIINNWSINETDERSVVTEIERILKSETKAFAEANDFDHKAFVKEVNFTDQSLFNITENIMDREYLNSIGVSEELSSKVILFMETFIDLDGSQHVSELEEMFLSHYADNVNDLSESDGNLYGMMVDVAIHSAVVWSPTDKGGLNRLADLRKGNAAGRASAWPGWGKIFMADSAGILTGAALSLASTGGASALPNPVFGGVPTASVMGLIAGAGASVGKAI